MFFQYYQPAEDIAALTSSYYDLRLPGAMSDIMRAEIANIRFVLRGCVISDQSGADVPYRAPCAVICGPTFRWSHIRFEEDTHVFGIAVAPMGWAQLFGKPADQYADETIPLLDLLDGPAADGVEAVLTATCDEDRVEAADAFVRAGAETRRRINAAFLEQATEWLVDPEPNELEEFINSSGLSHRQVDRLCRRYFGASPKKVHRKFRALHAANRLCWQDLKDWRDIAATSYYDQAHFSREFKQFNGRSPREFVQGPHLLVRMTLEQRRAINHANPFSLIG